MQQPENDTISVEIVRMQAAEQPSREAVRQSIVNRLDAAIARHGKDLDAAEEAASQRLRAVRKDLERECGALGHMFSKSAPRLSGVAAQDFEPRRCVFCGAGPA